MDEIDVAYWINLPSAAERRKHMKTVLSDDAFKNIPTFRMVANVVTTKTKHFNFPTSFIEFMKHQSVTNKEYGCLLSHLNTIRNFANSKYEIALILEDDITLELKPYWDKNIIKNAPPDWEILKLNSHLSHKSGDPLYKKLTFPCSINAEDKLPQCQWRCSAYVIKKSAAKKLMKMWDGKKYNLPENTYYVSDYLIYDLLTTYDYKYQYFLVRKNNDTSVQPKLATKKDNKTRRLVLSMNKTRKNIQ